MAIKNFWSLQVGEVIVADLIKKNLGKDYTIFMPLDNQLKSIDLVLVNLRTKKLSTIQVKESREFTQFLGNGWIIVNKEKVDNLVADFYTFVIYRTVEHDHQVKIKPEIIIVPSKILKERSASKRVVKNKDYYYFFKVGNGIAYDDHEGRNRKIDYSDCLNNFDLLKI